MTTINATGRITKDFELKKSNGGCIYANFSLAVNEGYGDKQVKMFFECTIFGADAERLVKAKAKKGSLIQITGKFGVSEFTRTNGDPGYSLKITVLAWSYIPGTNGKKDGNGENGEGNVNTPPPSHDADAPPPPTDEDFNATTNLDDEDAAF